MNDLTSQLCELSNKIMLHLLEPSGVFSVKDIATIHQAMETVTELYKLRKQHEE